MSNWGGSDNNAESACLLWVARALPFGLRDHPLKRLPQLWIQLQALLEILLCFVRAALPEADNSARTVSVGVSRFERDILGEIGFCARPLSLALPPRGAIEPGVGKARVELDGPIVIGQHAVEVAFDLGYTYAVAGEKNLARHALAELHREAKKFLFHRFISPPFTRRWARRIKLSPGWKRAFSRTMA
jgi:hypothetical protein